MTNLNRTFGLQLDLRGKLTLWDKLVLFIFALMLFDSANGFDTNLNSLFILSLGSLQLRPQELLIILAVFYVVFRPASASVLIRTTTGCLMIVFFLIAGIWTCIRIYEGEVTNTLIRMYLGWISVPIALCITLRKWESVAMSFYMVVVAGFIGAFVLGATALFGIDAMSNLFPNVTQRSPEAYNPHVAFFGQSYTWVRFAMFYVTANMLFLGEANKRFKWLVLLVYFLALDIVAMRRARFVYDILFLLFGLSFVAPVLGVYFKTRVRVAFVVLMIVLIISTLCFLSGSFDTFGFFLKSRYSSGVVEVITKSGSFAAHYLAPFERLDLLAKAGLIKLLVGDGPVKDSEIQVFYGDDNNVSLVHTNALRAVTGDSPHATLIGWYGLLGLFLMTFMAIICFGKYLRISSLDARSRYIGALASIAFALDGIFVASSSSALEVGSIILVWTAFIEHYDRGGACIAAV